MVVVVNTADPNDSKTMSARTAKQAKENDSSAQGKQKQSPQQELNASWADLRRFLVRDRGQLPSVGHLFMQRLFISKQTHPHTPRHTLHAVRMLLQRHSREPICVRRSDTVQDAFSRLCDNDILAAPVVDWEDRYEGFVSMLDLTSFAGESIDAGVECVSLRWFGWRECERGGDSVVCLDWMDIMTPLDLD